MLQRTPQCPLDGPQCVKHSPIEGHLGSIQFLAIMSKNCCKHCVKVLCEHKFYFSGMHARETHAGSYSSCMFSFVRNCQTILQSGCTIVQSHQQCTKDPVSQHPCQYLGLVTVFLDVFIGMQWCLILVLVCISLMANEVEH